MNKKTVFTADVKLLQKKAFKMVTNDINVHRVKKYFEVGIGLIQQLFGKNILKESKLIHSLHLSIIAL